MTNFSSSYHSAEVHTSDTEPQNSFGNNLENGLKPPPLPPRSTRPDYVRVTVATESPGTISDTSSIIYTDDENGDVSSTIAKADDEAELWVGMPEFDFQDETLNGLFDRLALVHENPSVPLQDVNRTAPNTPVHALAKSKATPSKVPKLAMAPSTPIRALAKPNPKATPSKAPKQVAGLSRLFSTLSTPVKAGKYNFYVVSKGSQVGIFNNW